MMTRPNGPLLMLWALLLVFASFGVFMVSAQIRTSEAPLLYLGVPQANRGGLILLNDYDNDNLTLASVAAYGNALGDVVGIVPGGHVTNVVFDFNRDLLFVAANTPNNRVTKFYTGSALRSTGLTQIFSSNQLTGMTGLVVAPKVTAMNRVYFMPPNRGFYAYDLRTLSAKLMFHLKPDAVIRRIAVSRDDSMVMMIYGTFLSIYKIPSNHPIIKSRNFGEPLIDVTYSDTAQLAFILAPETIHIISPGAREAPRALHLPTAHTRSSRLTLLHRYSTSDPFILWTTPANRGVLLKIEIPWDLDLTKAVFNIIETPWASQASALVYIEKEIPLPQPEFKDDPTHHLVFGPTLPTFVLSDIRKNNTDNIIENTTIWYDSFETSYGTKILCPEHWAATALSAGNDSFVYTYKAILSSTDEINVIVQYSGTSGIRANITPTVSYFTKPYVTKFTIYIARSTVSTLFVNSTETLLWTACYLNNEQMGELDLSGTRIKPVEGIDAVQYIVPRQPWAVDQRPLTVTVPNIGVVDGKTQKIPHTHAALRKENTAHFCIEWTFPHFEVDIVYDPDVGVLIDAPHDDGGQSSSSDEDDSSDGAVGIVIGATVGAVCGCVCMILLFSLTVFGGSKLYRKHGRVYSSLSAINLDEPLL